MFRALVFAVLFSAAHAGANEALAGTPPYEVSPRNRSRAVPLNAEVRVFGRLAKTPDAGWSLVSPEKEDVPCEVTGSESPTHRFITLRPRELLQADAGYSVLLATKEVARFMTGAALDVSPPTAPVLTGAKLHEGSLLAMTSDSWELLGTASTDDQPGLEYLVTIAPADAGFPADSDLVLWTKGLPNIDCASCIHRGSARIDPKNFEVRLVAIDAAGHVSAPATVSVREPKSRGWIIVAVGALIIAGFFVVRLRRMRAVR